MSVTGIHRRHDPSPSVTPHINSHHTLSYPHHHRTTTEEGKKTSLKSVCWIPCVRERVPSFVTYLTLVVSTGVTTTPTDPFPSSSPYPIFQGHDPLSSEIRDVTRITSLSEYSRRTRSPTFDDVSLHYPDK